jgi:hypothetical protein
VNLRFKKKVTEIQVALFIAHSNLYQLLRSLASCESSDENVQTSQIPVIHGVPVPFRCSPASA